MVQLLLKMAICLNVARKGPRVLIGNIFDIFVAFILVQDSELLC